MAQSNIYGAGAASIFELFGDYVEGDAGRAALVLASKRPCDASLDALDKSFAAFGYGTDAFSVATIEPLDASAEGGDIPLDSQALFLLVEGLDPLLLICADAEAVSLACLAYRSQFSASIIPFDVCPANISAVPTPMRSEVNTAGIVAGITT